MKSIFKIINGSSVGFIVPESISEEDYFRLPYVVKQLKLMEDKRLMNNLVNGSGFWRIQHDDVCSCLLDKDPDVCDCNPNVRVVYRT